MTVSVVFAIAGVIALLFGIIGGGVRAKELEVPPLAGKVRIITGVIGLILIGLAIIFEVQNRSLNRALLQQGTLAVPRNVPATDLPATTVAPTAMDTAVISTPTATQTWVDRANSKYDEVRNWNSLFYDSFDDNSYNWVLDNEDNASYTMSMQINSGVLYWGLKLKEPDWYFYRQAPLDANYADFYLSAKMGRAAVTDSIGQPYWGVIFRKNGENFYAFEINDAQQYAVESFTASGSTEIIRWTKSMLIEPDKFNQLTVIADGPELYFFINGSAVNFVNDHTYTDGNVGLLAGLENVKTEITYFVVDDFELRGKPY